MLLFKKKGGPTMRAFYVLYAGISLGIVAIDLFIKVVSYFLPDLLATIVGLILGILATISFQEAMRR